MRLHFVFPALALAGLSMFGMTHEAEACGACIPPPSVNTVVTGHRMALSVSPKQTVLWDQIEYSGAPESFAWVLPVKPGASIQLSSDAWFDTLDAATNTQIFQPPISCATDEASGSGFGCGYADEAGRAFDGAAENGGPAVTVVSRGSVGPYSTVTLSTDTPGALNTWLTMNGFSLDPKTQPVVDAYIAEGFDFIALKLLPGEDVQSMKPVRVVQAGANPTLPLRMVAIGTGANVALTLFLISEGRWEAQNFKNVEVPANLIAWDFKDSSSNYSSLREKVLAENDGATWLTTFAFQGALLGQLQGLSGFSFGPRTYGSPGSGSISDTIASAYVRQALSDGQLANEECTAQLANIGASGLMVTNPCPLDKPFGDPSCGNVGANEIDARSLVCGLMDPEPIDDVAVALNGLHPKDVWLTRIEANLPQSALGQDLVVQPAKEQTALDNLKFAGVAKNPEVVCGTGASIVPMGTNNDKSGRGTRENLLVLVTLGLLSVAAMARRRAVVA
jgi:Uncharacterized protein conserved in bacteria (DUF2330)